MRELLDRVAESGPPRNTEISYDLDKRKGIWEFIQGDLRVLWFYDEGRLIICSHGIVKKRRRTPRNDINRACRTFNAYTDAKARRQLLFEREDDE
jgi:phage-related protein